MEHLISLTYNPVGVPVEHTARSRRVRTCAKLKRMCEHVPVSGDLKSGIPADVLTPVYLITRDEKQTNTAVNLSCPRKNRPGERGCTNVPAPN